MGQDVEHLSGGEQNQTWPRCDPLKHSIRGGAGFAVQGIGEQLRESFWCCCSCRIKSQSTFLVSLNVEECDSLSLFSYSTVLGAFIGSLTSFQALQSFEFNSTRSHR